MPAKEFSQITWDEEVEEDCRRLIRLAVREDLHRDFDWTTVALVDSSTTGDASVVARKAGTIAGLEAARIAFEEMAPSVAFLPAVRDGQQVTAGTPLAKIHGPARDLLTCERIMLNVLGRLCGVATLTRRYVDAVTGTGAKIYDTRKTTPGWRRLEKYAVHCGGGCNHRTGLFDAILIKDNHLALAHASSAAASPSSMAQSGAEAVRKVRSFLAQANDQDQRREMMIEIEVDTLEQLAAVLPAKPDIVLLDNMPPQRLREAVVMRDQSAPDVQLEASGGIDLETVRSIAETGVERISVGGLTHSAAALDVALDWDLGV